MMSAAATPSVLPQKQTIRDMHSQRTGALSVPSPAASVRLILILMQRAKRAEETTLRLWLWVSFTKDIPWQTYCRGGDAGTEGRVRANTEPL